MSRCICNFEIIRIKHLFTIRMTSGTVNVPQFLESRLRLQELPRISHLDNPPRIHHHHKVEINDRVQLVCHGDDGPAAELLAHNIHDHVCGVLVHTARWVMHLLADIDNPPVVG